MARLLTGTPTVVRPGTTSVAGLAREAEVNRNHLTQGSCRDLAERFVDLTRVRNFPATLQEARQHDRIVQLAEQLDQLRAAHAAVRGERDRWHAATHTVLRAIQVMRLEHQAMAADLEQLRNQAHRSSAVQTKGLYVVPGTGGVAVPAIARNPESHLQSDPSR